MHHFLYAFQDSYISSKPTENNVNYGLDEMLLVGVSQSYAEVLNVTKSYHFTNNIVVGLPLENYTGIISGSFFGTAILSGSLIGSSTQFTTSYFSGDVSGSLYGVSASIPLQNTNFSGSLIGFYGNINSYAINGVVSGSTICNCFKTFIGNVTNSVGNVSGYLTGDDYRNELNITRQNINLLNRSLVQFDVTYVSKSLVNGDITNPKFFLKLKSTEARELPTTYKIYAFPISQSWTQGDGYWSDGGSNNGVSWKYKTYNQLDPWYSPYVTTPISQSVDYLNDYTQVTESWKRGGTTWYNLACTQSFNYESGDINMDVTPIVNAWVSGTVGNNGLVLIHSDEIAPSASNAHLFFFSKNTNTIYGPRLEIVWDDSSFITGSFGTSSVNSETLLPGISGSILSTSSITGISVTGSFGGNALLLTDTNGFLQNGSNLSVYGTSGNIKGLSISGLISGSASFNGSSTQVDAFLTSGNFSGSEVQGVYSQSMFTGLLTGSWDGSFLSNSWITGSIFNVSTNAINAMVNVFQNSSAPGNVLGTITSVGYSPSGVDSGQITGVAIDGLLQGATLNLYITGSNCVVSSSITFTDVELTGSALHPLNTIIPFVVIIQDLKPVYSFGDMPRIGIFARSRFPLKTFEKAPQQPTYITPNFLPSSSFYAIKDNQTEEIVIDFDNYTKVSCDPNGNYFYLDTTGLQEERYYRILIRVIDQTRVYTFDSGDVFKVRR